jgi:hypothetical protein
MSRVHQSGTSIIYLETYSHDILLSYCPSFNSHLIQPWLYHYNIYNTTRHTEIKLFYPILSQSSSHRPSKFARFTPNLFWLFIFFSTTFLKFQKTTQTIRVVFYPFKSSHIWITIPTIPTTSVSFISMPFLLFNSLPSVHLRLAHKTPPSTPPKTPSSTCHHLKMIT